MKKFLLLFIPILTFSILFTTNKTYAQEYPQGETWMINESPNIGSIPITPVINGDKDWVFVNFISDGFQFSKIAVSSTNGTSWNILKYDNELVYVFGGWYSSAYRIITFESAPTGDLLTWLQANAVKVSVPNDGYDEGYQDGYDEGYQDGYDEGYQDGFIAGEKSKIAKNNESFYNNIAIWIPAVITLVALASIISIFGIKKKE